MHIKALLLPPPPSHVGGECNVALMQILDSKHGISISEIPENLTA